MTLICLDVAETFLTRRHQDLSTDFPTSHYLRQKTM